jgi:hypothetical protein
MSDAGSEYDEDFDEVDKDYIGVSVFFIFKIYAPINKFCRNM